MCHSLSKLPNFIQESIRNYYGLNFENIFEHINLKRKYIDAGFTQVCPVYNLENKDLQKHFDSIRKIWQDKDITIICGKTIFNKLTYNIFDCAQNI